jgi:hypothetical protein
VTSSGKPAAVIFLAAKKQKKSHMNHQIVILTQEKVNSIHNAQK